MPLAHLIIAGRRDQDKISPQMPLRVQQPLQMKVNLIPKLHLRNELPKSSFEKQPPQDCKKLSLHTDSPGPGVHAEEANPEEPRLPVHEVNKAKCKPYCTNQPEGQMFRYLSTNLEGLLAGEHHLRLSLCLSLAKRHLLFFF